MESIKLTSERNRDTEIRVLESDKSGIELLVVILPREIKRGYDVLKKSPVVEVNIRFSQELYKEIKTVMPLQFGAYKKQLPQAKIQTRLQEVEYSINLGEFCKPAYIHISDGHCYEHGVLGESLNNVEIQFKELKNRYVSNGWGVSISKAEWVALCSLIEGKPLTVAFKTKYTFTPFGHVVDAYGVLEKHNCKGAFEVYKDVMQSGDTLTAMHTSFDSPKETTVHSVDLAQNLIWITHSEGFFALNSIPYSVAVFNKKDLVGVDFSIRKFNDGGFDFNRIFVKGCELDYLKKVIVNKNFSDWRDFKFE